MMGVIGPGSRRGQTAVEVPMQAVLEDAVEQFRRQRFIAEVNAGYARVRENEQAWGAVLEEREPWELTTGDGLGDER